jgi:hypothetical protein
LEVCGQCADFPCAKYEKDSAKKDSFVTHKRMMANQEMIAKIGLEAFLEQQAERIEFLEVALERHNNGRNKSFFCLAAALLPLESLREALELADGGENLRGLLNGFAKVEGVELTLVK